MPASYHIPFCITSLNPIKSQLIFNISMSLDGFVAGPNHEVDQVFRWYFSGDTDYPFPGSDMVFKISKASAALLDQAAASVGAAITGRRNFDGSQAWHGRPPLGVPHVVMTHNPPREWVKAGSPFTFVGGGIHSAVAKARELAGGKDVVISTPSVMQQALNAGLLDEIHIDLTPVLLGEGVRLFDHLGPQPVNLEITRVVEGQGVTHLAYRVIR